MNYLKEYLCFVIDVQFENIQQFIEKNNISRSTFERSSNGRRGSSRGKLSRISNSNRPSRRTRKKSRSDTEGSDNCASRRGLRTRRERVKPLSKPSMKSKLESSELSPHSLKKDDNHFPRLGKDKQQIEDTNVSADHIKC